MCDSISRALSGYVEIFDLASNAWHYLCVPSAEAGWGDEDARVACKQIGYDEGMKNGSLGRFWPDRKNHKV